MQVHRSRDWLDSLFHALSDANRRGMVERLSLGPASVKELARPFAMALPSVLKHLHVLETGGGVVSEKVGRVRTYRLAPDALAPVEAWVADRQATWNRHFDRLQPEQPMDGTPRSSRRSRPPRARRGAADRPTDGRRRGAT